MRPEAGVLQLDTPEARSIESGHAQRLSRVAWRGSPGQSEAQEASARAPGRPPETVYAPPPMDMSSTQVVRRSRAEYRPRVGPGGHRVPPRASARYSAAVISLRFTYQCLWCRPPGGGRFVARAGIPGVARHKDPFYKLLHLTKRTSPWTSSLFPFSLSGTAL